MRRLMKFTWLAPLLIAAQLTGCAGGDGPDLDAALEASEQEEAPLGGEALAHGFAECARGISRMPSMGTLAGVMLWN